MKQNCFAVLFSLVFLSLWGQDRVGIGTISPHASAVLDITSINKGLLIPRMTFLQRTGISSPGTGLLVYQTNTSGFNTPGLYMRMSDGWKRMLRADETQSSTSWTIAGTNQFSAVSGNVGIGTETPNTKLHIVGSAKLNFPAAFGPILTMETTYLPVPNMPNTTGINFQRNGDWAGSVYYYSPNMVAGNPNPVMTPGILRFSVSEPSANDMVITTSGRVGIGRSNPAHPLHVEGTIYTDDDIIIDQPSGILQLQSDGVNKGFLQLSGDHLRLGTNSGNTAGEVVFRINGSNLFTMVNNSSSALMRLNFGSTHVGTMQVNSLGNLSLSTVGSNDLIILNTELYVNGTANRVGIGTSSPAQKLDVQGNVQILGDVHLSGRVLKQSNTDVQLTPVCFGRVNSLANVISGSQNFTAENITEGHFRVHNPDILHSSTIIAFLNMSNAQVILSGGCSDGHCNIYMKDAMGGFAAIDQNFMFVVYK